MAKSRRHVKPKREESDSENLRTSKIRSDAAALSNGAETRETREVQGSRRRSSFCSPFMKWSLGFLLYLVMVALVWRRLPRTNKVIQNIDTAWDEFFAKNSVYYLETARTTATRTINSGTKFAATLSSASGALTDAEARVEKSRPGYKLAKEGAKAKFPIIIIPGFVTTGLELWGGEDCAKRHFRQRLWGSVTMAQSFFTDRDCWRRHMALDPYTGMDPTNIRLRASQGFEAADYFMGNYWVWGKMLENLADVGYDGSMMTMMGYDWRLSFPLMEERDGYLTKLKHSIEAMKETTGEKTVILSHSMGAQLTLYFFAWVTAPKKEGGGGGGDKWVDEYVHSFVNIAGPVLGVIKAVPALLSGEMKDTAVLLGTVGSMAEQFFGRKVRKDLWNTWGSLWAMLPKGGNAVWGIGADICDNTTYPDGLTCRPIDDGTENRTNSRPQQIHDNSFVPFISMTDAASASDSPGRSDTLVQKSRVTDFVEAVPDLDVSLPDRRKVNREDIHPLSEEKTGDLSIEFSNRVYEFSQIANVSIEETLVFLVDYAGGYGSKSSSANLHPLLDNEKSKQTTKKSRPIQKSRWWHDPTLTPLPYAPNMKIYCMYGHGLGTERAYYYQRAPGRTDVTLINSSDKDGRKTDIYADPPFVLNTTVHAVEHSISHGVMIADGDGSVPLVSLGYMCVDSWVRPETGYNPSGAQVVTREYKDRGGFQVEDPLRGGPGSADHVDVMGNLDMTLDVLKVVTDFEPVEELITSDIRNIVQRINSHPKGGLKLSKNRMRGPKRLLKQLLQRKKT